MEKPHNQLLRSDIVFADTVRNNSSFAEINNEDPDSLVQLRDCSKITSNVA